MEILGKIYVNRVTELDIRNIIIQKFQLCKVDIIQRTKQHYFDGRDSKNWQYELHSNDAKLYIIGHEHFNKSMTLDVENRLMHYMMSCENVNRIYNRKGNP